MTDPAQVAERPPVPGDAGPDHRWVARPDRDWSTHPDELIGRRCRFMENRRGHGVPAVAVLFRGSTTGPRPYGYCAKHLYGRWIEDGVVTQWVLEPRP